MCGIAGGEGGRWGHEKLPPGGHGSEFVRSGRLTRNRTPMPGFGEAICAPRSGTQTHMYLKLCAHKIRCYAVLWSGLLEQWRWRLHICYHIMCWNMLWVVVAGAAVRLDGNRSIPFRYPSMQKLALLSMVIGLVQCCCQRNICRMYT